MDTENNLSALNALLAKSKGDVANLVSNEIIELQRLASKHLANEFRSIAEKYYPKRPLITALLKEEMHRRRVSQYQLCEILGMNAEYFNKIITGKTKIGMKTANKIRQRLGVDGNYIMDIV
ncbi:MAG: helix-turn-helix domain-containing protein [Prevotellaceae bacterium]|jgi:antitoxin component HigA of HigAB toxin-antitoxin module|nr:helix-turn-helix domain-containing protein [Prevotellaceae bacterium]